MAICPRCQRDVGYELFCPDDGTPVAHLEREFAPIELQPGSLVDGRYEIVAELGQGGVGVVYLASARALGKDVAIKVLRPGEIDNDRVFGRFAREARATSRIDHPNVVKVFDFGFAAEGFYFLVMELLEGISLADILRRTLRLTPVRALNLLEQIASGLARAHELDVVHRDLKPENVMVRREDEEIVTIVDFGLAKAIGGWAGGKLTMEGALVGTPEYMSPEQWHGIECDARADIYSFGVTAYEMLAGSLPLGGTSIVEIMHAHLKQEPLPLEDVLGPLPAGLSELVSHCLQKDRDHRPQTMTKVREELRTIAADAATIVTAGRKTEVTELVITDIGALSAAALQEEIERLRIVRRHRLRNVLATLPDPPDWCRNLVAAIERTEVDLEQLEREVAVNEARVTEIHHTRGQTEAQLRHALVDASLHVAVGRAALPPELRNQDNDTPTLDEAEIQLIRAEEALAEFLSGNQPELVEAKRAVEQWRTKATRADDELIALYERLEARLHEYPGGVKAAAMLRAIDSAIATYRSKLSAKRTPGG